MTSTTPSSASTTPTKTVTPADAAANSSASSIVNDPTEVLGELDGGQYLLMLARALGSVSSAVVDNGRKGKITLDLEFTQIKKTQQVAIKHALKFTRPTMDGEAAEKVGRETVMHVGKYGKLSIMPESQMSLLTSGNTMPPGAGA